MEGMTDNQFKAFLRLIVEKLEKSLNNKDFSEIENLLLNLKKDLED